MVCPLKEAGGKNQTPASRAKEHLVVLPLFGAAGQPLNDWKITVSVGMARSSACKLVCDLALGLSDEELKTMMKEVASTMQCKAVIQPVNPVVDILTTSIRSKFIVSESTRPDIIQLFTGLKAHFSYNGLKYEDAIGGFIQNFNKGTSVESGRISEGDQKMLILLPCQQAQFIKSVECHWDNYKIQDSGLPLKTLIMNIDRVKKLDTKSAPQLWQSILEASEQSF